MSFKVGERVQVVNDPNRFAMAGKQGTVIGRSPRGYWSVGFSNGSAMEGAYRTEDLIPAEAIMPSPPKPSIKVGDRVRTSDGYVGVVQHCNDGRNIDVLLDPQHNDKRTMTRRVWYGDALALELLPPSPKPSFKVGDRVRLRQVHIAGFGDTPSSLVGIEGEVTAYHSEEDPPELTMVDDRGKKYDGWLAERFELVEQPTTAQEQVDREIFSLLKGEPMLLDPKERGAGIARLDLKPPARAPMRHQTALWDPYGDLDLLAEDA